ncbi:MAG TPA: TIGR03435 family protein [Bryobacteraceae bacterium]|nr:TIGR03435 family protein [Bryobacteraceae bacterium]
MKNLAPLPILSLLAGALFAQSGDAPPQFEIADIHTSAKATFPFARQSPVRGGRFEIKNATMVDLIRTAYGIDNDKVLGGPNWLEMDRFDVIAKVPADSTADTHKLMLQLLLADRFKLLLHKDNKPLPTYALVAGKKPLMKESDGSGDTGCRPVSPSGAPQEGGMRLFMNDVNGRSTTLNLGPGMTVQFQCRNVTMAQFADNLRGMIGANVGTNPVIDDTGLKGNWNFDVKWSMQIMGPMNLQGDRITIFEALEKQLGLKLEERQVSTPVIVVDSVNEKPTDNPPGLAEILPPIVPPTEFEVADLKPSDPNANGSRYQMQPGGRLSVQGMPLRFLISRAFNANNSDEVVGVPKWADSDRYDVTAKAPSQGPSAPALDPDSAAPMIRALLVERFKMTYHKEERPVSAYSLVAAKPKMKKADPASRTWCKNPSAPAGSPPGTRILNCQNITMAQFADRLQNMAPGLSWPVLDATGITGGWDFTLSYTQSFQFASVATRGGGGDGPRATDAMPLGGGGGGAVPTAADPVAGYTIFEAIEKQLGLKLETQKRPMPVFVIDHMEQKPTEN